jgi:hypothetical protein
MNLLRVWYTSTAPDINRIWDKKNRHMPLYNCGLLLLIWVKTKSYETKKCRRKLFAVSVGETEREQHGQKYDRAKRMNKRWKGRRIRRKTIRKELAPSLRQQLCVVSCMCRRSDALQHINHYNRTPLCRVTLTAANNLISQSRTLNDYRDQ